MVFFVLKGGEYALRYLGHEQLIRKMSLSTVEILKKHYKMSWKYKNRRRKIEENLSNDSYVFLNLIIFQMQSTCILSRATELPRQSEWLGAL
jgi:hypothetical protein